MQYTHEIDYIYKKFKVKKNERLDHLFAKNLEHARKLEESKKADVTLGGKATNTNILVLLSNEELPFVEIRKATFSYQK